MELLREDILSKDPIIRVILAFYDFVRKNSDWNNRIENTVADKLKMSDYDFEFDKRLYSFFYEYIDNNNVRCCVKEFNKFYDTAKSYDYVIFDYNLLDKMITKICQKGSLKVNG